MKSFISAGSSVQYLDLPNVLDASELSKSLSSKIWEQSLTFLPNAYIFVSACLLCFEINYLPLAPLRGLLTITIHHSGANA